MDKEAILNMLEAALLEHQIVWDEGKVTVEGVMIEEPGPMLRINLSDGSAWVVTVTEG